MELSEFTSLVHRFSSLSQTDQILHFAWYLHTYKHVNVITQAEIRNCYEQKHWEHPNLSLLFKRLIDRRPKVVLASGRGVQLEGKQREQFDKKYLPHETTIAVTQLLKNLAGTVSNEAERLFLSEAIKCYHVKAFRAAIVMAWNLAYDHLLHWILADAGRVSQFNGKILARVGPKKGTGLVMVTREHFEELKEQEVLDICSSAGLFSSNNTKKLLDIQLTKRNLAAHPSLLAIEGPQADDTITSLVNNIVLVLK